MQCGEHVTVVEMSKAKKTAKKTKPRTARTSAGQKVAPPVTLKKSAASKSAVPKRPAAKKPAPSEKAAPKKQAAAKPAVAKRPAAGNPVAAKKHGGKQPVASKKAAQPHRPAAVTPPKAPKPPKRPKVDPEWLRSIRDALISRRKELLSLVQSTRAEMAQRDGDLADVSDRASEGVEDDLAVGLMAIEAAQLDDIEDAIRRIDEGTFGLCADCDKPIPRKRLEILPFARRCLACEGQTERLWRVAPSDSYSDD